MASVIYDYEIPDIDQPLPNDGGLGPSGRLKPFAPPPIAAGQVIGRTVEEICAHVGTYGMGGPGFFGLRLGAEWLVIAVWGAGEWLVVQGRRVQDTFRDRYGRSQPWIGPEGDELSGRLVGRTISSLDVQRHSLRIVFDNAVDLAIEETPDNRPLFEGTKEPRQLADDDDLRRAVFLAPTIEIWV